MAKQSIGKKLTKPRLFINEERGRIFNLDNSFDIASVKIKQTHFFRMYDSPFLSFSDVTSMSLPSVSNYIHLLARGASDSFIPLVMLAIDDLNLSPTRPGCIPLKFIVT